jgi:hypothetical protein
LGFALALAQQMSPRGDKAMTDDISDDTNQISDRNVMERYGISRTTADIFHYGPYRYTNLKDAVAQAERDKSLSSEGSSR